MADWSKPSLSDAYVNFQDLLKARDFDAISLGLNTITAPQAGMMRYVRASNVFQEYDGANWNNKVLAVAGGGTGSSTPAGAIGALGLGTMAVQNANAVNITGGSITGLNSLSSNGTLIVSGNSNLVGSVQLNDTLAISGRVFCNGITNYLDLVVGGLITAGNLVSNSHVIADTGTVRGNFLNSNLDLGVGRNATVAGNMLADNGIVRGLDVTALRNFNAVGNISGGSLNINGNINANVDIIAARNLGVSGLIYAGTPGRQITQGDGSIAVNAIAPGTYTGSGTKVLLDNGTWGDAGGGVVQILHLGANFPEGVNVVTVNLGWVVPPPDITRLVAQFDMYGLANDSYRFEFIGPTQINVWKTNPTLLTTNMWFTVIQYKTEH